MNISGAELWVDGRLLPASGVQWVFEDQPISETDVIDVLRGGSFSFSLPLSDDLLNFCQGLMGTARAPDEGQGMTLDELLGAIDEELKGVE